MAARRNPNMDPGFDPSDQGFDVAPDDFNFDAGPVASAPYPAAGGKDEWGNDFGSEQAGTDAFWNQVTNKHRNDFSDDELSGWGVSRVSGDKYRLKNGQEVDTVADYGGENRMGQWTISGGKPGQNGQYAGPPGAPPGLFGPVGGFAAGGAQGGSGKANMFGDDLTNALKGMFPGGAFNQDIVNRRTENANEGLQRQRKSRLATNRAMMADRGLLGSGAESQAYGNMESDLGDQYTNAVSGIYADESENADQRMMQALQIAAGMSEEDANMAVQWFKANNDRDLGMGNLALGNMNGQNAYNLGLANYGLNRDKTMWDMDNGNMNQMIQLLDILNNGAGTASRGRI